MKEYQPNRYEQMYGDPKDDRGPSDPCKGPNPPAYCFIGKKADDTMAAAPPIVPMFRFMNRGGMVEDAPMGTGIMDLEAARQMMFLGGIAKGIKKGLKSWSDFSEIFNQSLNHCIIIMLPDNIRKF